MKRCQDCRWSRRDWITIRGDEFRKCLNPQAYGNNHHPYVAYCDIERAKCWADIPICGPTARYFEPRVPLWRRVLRAIWVLP